VAQNNPRIWHTFFLTCPTVEFTKVWFEAHPPSPDLDLPAVWLLSLEAEMVRSAIHDVDFRTSYAGRDDANFLADRFRSISPRLTPCFDGPRGVIYILPRTLEFKTPITPSASYTLEAFIQDVKCVIELKEMFPPSNEFHINTMQVLYRQPVTEGGVFVAKYLAVKFRKFHIPKARAVKDAVTPYLAGETLIPVDLQEIAPDVRANAREYRGRNLYSTFGTPIRRNVIENDSERIVVLLPLLLDPLPLQNPVDGKEEFLYKTGGTIHLQPFVVFRRCDGTTIIEERPDIKGCHVTKRGN
jgi:hypothetical protein